MIGAALTTNYGLSSVFLGAAVLYGLSVIFIGLMVPASTRRLVKAGQTDRRPDAQQPEQ
jgi:ABC-type Fe3+-siderophore transport system permease subunit